MKEVLFYFSEEEKKTTATESNHPSFGVAAIHRTPRRHLK